MGTFCHEVAGAVEGLAVACGTFGGIGFAFWATALSTKPFIIKPFIIKPTITKSKNLTLFISALLWRVRLALVSGLQFPWWRRYDFPRGKFCWRRGECRPW